MESSNSSLCFSISSSSSSSCLNLLDLDNEAMLKSDKNTLLFPHHSFPSSKKRGHDYGKRFYFVEGSDEKEHHYLESCFLCKKPILQDHELFMYRGDAAFCSENCRMDQMEMDESLETIARRQRIIATSSSSSITSNCSVKNNSNDNQNNGDGLKRRPTIANLNSGSPLVAR